MSEHDTDILRWSEHQAMLLRRLAAGERVNDQVDWSNVIDEVESVGNEQLHAVESLLVQALRHDLRAHCWPLSREVPHWRAEARVARGDAASRFAPSMRQRIDMDRICRRAVRGLPETIDDVRPVALPTAWPTLDELLSEES